MGLSHDSPEDETGIKKAAETSKFSHSSSDGKKKKKISVRFQYFVVVFLNTF